MRISAMARSTAIRSESPGSLTRLIIEAPPHKISGTSNVPSPWRATRLQLIKLTVPGSASENAGADEIGEPGDLVLGVPGREGEAQARSAFRHSRRPDRDHQEPLPF